jgi:hypothetical protein
MSTTTVLADDATTIVSEAPPAFSWSAAFAGAFIAAGVTFLLLTLGSGIGLSLISVRHETAHGAQAFLTGGAIYFLAAQAFGFAVGGHIVGRLIGPALETSHEEDWRAGMHGVTAWALAVVATASIVALSVIAAGSAATNGAVNGALASTVPGQARAATDTSPATAYWVDKLFRPANSQTASLAWRQYAQNDTGAQTDMPATTGETPSAQPNDSMQPSDTGMSTPPPSGDRHVFLSPAANTAAPPAATTPVEAATQGFRSLGADKAEAGRILSIGMANGGSLAADDRAQVARLISNDIGITYDAAVARVRDVEARIHDDEVQAADAARKAAAYASLWTAFALLFGAIVAVFAAVSARWEDDRERGIFPGTRVVETRYS